MNKTEEMKAEAWSQCFMTMVVPETKAAWDLNKLWLFMQGPTSALMPKQSCLPASDLPA